MHFTLSAAPSEEELVVAFPLKIENQVLPARDLQTPAPNWNRDNKKDLLVGTRDGNILYLENTGSDADPVFMGETTLYIGPEFLDVGYDARIDVADWDEDGVMDFLSGDW